MSIKGQKKGSYGYEVHFVLSENNFTEILSGEACFRMKSKSLAIVSVNTVMRNYTVVRCRSRAILSECNSSDLHLSSHGQDCFTIEIATYQRPK